MKLSRVSMVLKFELDIIPVDSTPASLLRASYVNSCVVTVPEYFHLAIYGPRHRMYFYETDFTVRNDTTFLSTKDTLAPCH